MGDLHRAMEEQCADVAKGAPDGPAAGESPEASANAQAGVAVASSFAAEVLSSVGWAPPAGSVEEGGLVPPLPPAPAPASESQAEPPGAVQAVGCPAGWSRTDRGYICDPQHRKRGRLTMFGRNLSMKCDVHQKCSLVETRTAASEAQMMAWLALTSADAEVAIADADQHGANRALVVSSGVGSSSSGAKA